MKTIVAIILLFGGCSSLFPAKYKKEKAVIQQKPNSVLILKKV